MHDDTSQMWRVTRVTFKYHGTLGSLIGAPTTHLNSCPRILPSEITSSTVSFCCRLDWLYFYFFPLRSFFPFDGARHGPRCCCCCCCFLALNFTNAAGVLYSNISVLYYMGCVIAPLYHYDISSGSGAARAVWSTWKRCGLPVHLHTVLQRECNALSINHWTVCCFHNGVVKARSGS